MKLSFVFTNVLQETVQVLFLEYEEINFFFTFVFVKLLSFSDSSVQSINLALQFNHLVVFHCAVIF